ncbi:hypothetical protein L6452_20837 [Arctium lappa]|uniref:Uncharacterized protein n=1 Tax=Arctium lappa TaxID=4217 RepID=A0ACB9BCH0_ARCLA|nr:hypothetical protein L6452_20837 [Arctium lappa]
MSSLTCILQLHIQAKSIRPLLEGKDTSGAARTRFGKILAFLVPTIVFLFHAHFAHRNLMGSVLLSFVQEGSLQYSHEGPPQVTLTNSGWLLAVQHEDENLSML